MPFCTATFRSELVLVGKSNTLFLAAAYFSIDKLNFKKSLLNFLLHKNIVKGSKYAVISFKHLSQVSELELQLTHIPLYKANRDKCLWSIEFRTEHPEIS